MTTLKAKKKQARRRRKRKLRYLRNRLKETRSVSARQRLLAKIRRISPRAPVPDR